MGKIQLLSETVASRIAAGEVVERPASVVKELLENAIDAHASTILISIAEGGIREIRVTDNGDGISAEDMPLSIVKHATSKIFTLDDLEHINSMGFRGEALASIAAVSMLTIKSRTKNSEFGSELYVKGGKLEYIRKAGLADGTTVIVENLFYNTPARLKFLKKPGAEAALISDMIARLIIANPHISFRYTVSGKVVYHSPGNGSLEDAIYSVYGFDMKQSLLPVDFQFNQMYLKGYVGLPAKTFKTQKYGTLLVNGRYVKNALVQRAVLRAYGERLLKGNFPFYVLNLTLPSDHVDVNVHPNKLAVHFRDENELEYVVLNAVEQVLHQTQRPPEFTLTRQTPALHSEQVLSHNSLKSVYTPEIRTNASIAAEEKENRKEKAFVKPSFSFGMLPVTQPVSTSAVSKSTEKNQLSEEERAKRIDEILAKAAKSDEQRKKSLAMHESQAFAADTQELQKFDLTLRNIRIAEQKSEEIKAFTETPSLESIFRAHIDFKIIGVAFDAYIIIESGNSLYLIDQHAAHERKLYDTLLQNIAEKPISQPLLAPVRAELMPTEKVLLENNLDIIRGMGFSFDAITDTYCDISAYPQILGEINLRQAMQDMIEALEDGEVSFQIRKDKIAKGACKRAIKAGMKMSEPDIRELITSVLRDDRIPHCPHGRPIVIKLTKTQLEDSFKRRV